MQWTLSEPPRLQGLLFLRGFTNSFNNHKIVSVGLADPGPLLFPSEEKTPIHSCLILNSWSQEAKAGRLSSIAQVGSDYALAECVRFTHRQWGWASVISAGHTMSCETQERMENFEKDLPFWGASLKIGKQSHFKPTYFPESSEKPSSCTALWFILTFSATVGYWESADDYGNRPDSNNQELTFSKCSCYIFPTLSTECSQSHWTVTLTPWGLCIIVLHLTTGETEPLRITKSMHLRFDALCTEEILLVTFLLSSLFFFSSMCQNVHSSLIQFIIYGF